MKFVLTAEELEILNQLESSPGLEGLSKAFSRDPTVISKQLKRIASKGDFLKKVSGRWNLTDTGKKLNSLTRDYLISQNKILHHEKRLVLGSTREFSTHILGVNAEGLKKDLCVDSLSLLSFDNGIEEPLLKGQIDFGFDCGRPYSPEIAYKHVLREPIIAVTSKKFNIKIADITKFKDLEKLPHILCDRLFPDKISGSEFMAHNIAIRTNDIAVARNLCISGAGWALLPKYTIQNELKNKILLPIRDFCFENEKFGVWYLRSRKNIRPYFELAIQWLKNQEARIL